VEVGEHTIEVTGGEGTTYQRPVRVQKGKSSLVTINFPELLAEEMGVWSGLKRGQSAEETLQIHRAFLERFPKGKNARKCQSILEDLEAEMTAFRHCGEATVREVRLRLCGQYLGRYANLEYPFGWYEEKVRALEREIRSAMESEAFDRIEGETDLPGKRKACNAYLEGFPTGARAGQVREWIMNLDREKEMHADFIRESVFWKRINQGKNYLARFEKGFWADEVRADLEAKLAAEKAAADAIVANDDVEAVLKAVRKYDDTFNGGPNAEAVLKRGQAAEEEQRVFFFCEDNLKRCREYLSRYPEGWYQKRVEGLVRTFSWPPEDTGGIGLEGKLPPGLRRAESVGEYVGIVDGAIMVYVHKGFFPMGTDDWRCKPSDRPAFMAWMGRYFIDKYEVSNAQYRKFLEAMKRSKSPHRFCHPDEPKGKSHVPEFWDDPEWNGDDQPVVGVDWFDAFAYARWAGKRLPTEAQWEKAASTDIKRKRKFRWPWGDERPEIHLCNFGKKEGEGRTEPVTSFPTGRSPTGAFHMAGNVSEWCLDTFREDFLDRFAEAPYGVEKWAVNPFNGEPSPFHTIRGGSWADKERNLLTTRRKGFKERSRRIGFRCAMWYNPQTLAKSRTAKDTDSR
ncbi:MAG: formylglycine-generating enzyme family protein, partial [Planctomycetota bacterium]|jgi:formylglycine-generating enzyme required for sulfatase activity